jgi:hypothetical protein
MMGRRTNPRAVAAQARRDHAEADHPPSDAVAAAWEICKFANGSCVCSTRKRGPKTACASIMPTADRVLRIARAEGR